MREGVEGGKLRILPAGNEMVHKGPRSGQPATLPGRLATPPLSAFPTSSSLTMHVEGTVGVETLPTTRHRNYEGSP